MRTLNVKISTLQNVKRVLFALLLIAITNFFLGDAHASKAEREPNPSHSDIIQSAIDERDKGHLVRAIDLLERGLKENPDNLRMKIELASCYFFVKDYSKATTLAKEVSASNTLPPVVRRNVISFLDKVENAVKSSQDTSYSLRHSLNVIAGHDSNANIAPEDTQIDIGELPSSLIEKEDEFYGYSYSLSQLKQIQLTPKAPNETRSLLQFHKGFNVYKKKYNEINNSDLLFVNGTFGTKYLSNGNWFAKAKASLTYVGLGNEGLLDYYHLATQVGYLYGTSELSFKLDADYRDYHDLLNEGRTGNSIRPTLIYTYNLSHDIKVNMKVGSRYSDLKDDSFSYSSDRYEVSTQFKLPLNATLSFGSHYSKSKYDDIQRFYSNKRKDETFRHHIKIDYPNFFRGIDSQLSYTYVDRRSNNDLNAYKRSVWLMTFKYQLGISKS